jgi:diphthamide synthase (EF-2-diphthine--ammonia ligase)
LTAESKTLEEMITRLREAVDELEAMRKDGVTLDPEGGTADDYATLVTSDPAIAKKYDMHDESEFWDDDEEVESAS